MAVTLSPYALVDLDTAKAELAIAGADTTQDDRIRLYINGASQFVETYTDRMLARRSALTEIRSGRRQNKLLLRQWPINAITELRIDANHTFTDPSTLIPATDYAIDEDLMSILYYRGAFMGGYNVIKVLYDAGYAPGSVPWDLQMAVLWAVQWYFRWRERRDIGIKSRSKGDETVQISEDIPPAIMRILINYKRTEFPSIDSPVNNL